MMSHSVSSHPIAKILIIDDQEEELELFEDLLNGSNYEVITTTQENEFMSLAREKKPSLAIIDIHLSDWDGVDLGVRVKREVPEMAIAFTSGYDMQDRIRNMFEFGAVDFLKKPFEPNTVDELIGRIGVHIDQIKETKRLNDRVTSMEHAAQMLVHDLANPLCAIIGYSDPGMLEENLVEDRQVIFQAGKRMNRIIEGVMSLLRLRKEPDYGPLDVEDCFESVLKESSISQDVIRRPDRWFPVIGYKPWIEIVWTNYLNNALKYASNSDCFEIGCEQIGDQVEYSIRDYGPGLSDGMSAENVFEAGVGDQGECKIQSYGIGLALVYRICEKMNGSCGVRVPEGGGCKFFFRMPVVPPKITI